MKRMILSLLIVLFAFTLFGQSYKQNFSKVDGMWPHISWIIQQNTATTGLTWAIESGDTLWSRTYRLTPEIYLDMVVSDTGAVDSVNFKTELWVSSVDDTTTLQFIKNLAWSKGSTTSYSTSVTSAGDWWCNMYNTPVPGFVNFRLRLMYLSGHKVKTGVSVRIDAVGHAN
jgi:hypothetical protein